MPEVEYTKAAYQFNIVHYDDYETNRCKVRFELVCGVKKQTYLHKTYDIERHTYSKQLLEHSEDFRALCKKKGYKLKEL